MNKKLLTLAVGAALAASAVAAHADLKISGVANVSVDQLNNGVNSGSFVSSNASNVVLSGSTDLGNGLSALFSAQTFLSFGSDNVPAVSSTTPTPISGFQYDRFGNGNTYAGLSGEFGMVAAGRNDTPMKQLGRAVDLFGNQIGDSRNLISTGLNGGFDQRPGHSVFYVSPNFAGVQVKAAYEAANADGAASGLGSGKKSHMDDLSATYNMGPLMAGIAYETDSVAGVANQQSAYRLGASYNMNPVKVVALYQHATNVETTGGSQNVWGIGAAWTFMPTYDIKAQYYRAGNSAGVANTGAHMMDVGFDHSLSKAASVYLDYAKTTNQTGATYSAFGPGHGNTLAQGAGQSAHGVSVGMIYNF